MTAIWKTHLDEIRSLGVAGQIVCPISFAHCVELSNYDNPEVRSTVASLMVELSQGRCIPRIALGSMQGRKPQLCNAVGMTPAENAYYLDDMRELSSTVALDAYLKVFLSPESIDRMRPDFRKFIKDVMLQLRRRSKGFFTPTFDPNPTVDVRWADEVFTLRLKNSNQKAKPGDPIDLLHLLAASATDIARPAVQAAVQRVMHPLPLIVATFALTASVTAAAATEVPAHVADGDALQEIEHARPNELSVELQQVERGGELRLDLWNGVAEAHFSVDGVSHVRLRHVDGAEEHAQVWLSPAIHDELVRGAPDVMLVFWAVLIDSRVYAQVEKWLSTLPTDPLRKNPACSVFKWGMKGVLAIAGAACCSGSFGFGCAICTVGGLAANDYLSDIECNNECKPDCALG